MKGMHYRGIGKTNIESVNFCGKTYGWILNSEKGLFAEPIETKPTKGEHDFETCDGCQEILRKLTIRLKNRFEGKRDKNTEAFPYCCSHHTNLVKIDDFNLESFAVVPKMVAEKIIYTKQHILNNHKNADYFKDITDYIEYTIYSFGQMPTDCGSPLYLDEYLFYSTHLLKEENEIPIERKKNILEFLDSYQNPQSKSNSTDFNLLVSIYEKWYKIFPFQLDVFKDLKPHFDKKLHILSGSPEKNIYTGLTRTKIHTRSSLIETLQALTLSLLDNVNVPELRNNGKITDIQANQLKFIEAELNTKTAAITKNYSKGELKYIKALKKWLTIHKKYFKEVSEIFDKQPDRKIKTKNEIFKEKLNKGNFYELEMVKKLTESGVENLIALLFGNMAYGIAMLEHLGFCSFLDQEYGSKYKTNRYLSRLYNEKAKDGTQARHYRNSLIKNKPRYTSYLHKDKVVTDYENLK